MPSFSKPELYGSPSALRLRSLSLNLKRLSCQEGRSAGKRNNYLKPLRKTFLSCIIFGHIVMKVLEDCKEMCCKIAGKHGLILLAQTEPSTLLPSLFSLLSHSLPSLFSQRQQNRSIFQDCLFKTITFPWAFQNA